MRRRAASPPVATTDLASLERFQRELIENGFKAIDPPDRRIWSGPLAPAFSGLTAAKTMNVEFVDGWPYRQPRLFVDGMSGEHVSNGGEVCLWTSGVRGRPWLTLDGFRQRIAEWAEAAAAGFGPNDAVLDAHLYFAPAIRVGIATVRLEDIGPRPQGAHGRIYGRWYNREMLLELSTRREGQELDGRWYTLDGVTSPPRSIAEIESLLTPPQRESLQAGLAAVDAGKGERLVLVVWETPAGPNALALTQRLKDGNVVVEAIETAPTDERYLAARAGPDFEALQGKRALLFGAGAVGSHVAVRLAESGIGHLAVRDSEILRPGNIVRHAARRARTSWPKTVAVEHEIADRVSWTKVECGGETWDPQDLTAAIDGSDVVIDATGNAGFCDLLSELSRRQDKPLVSVALYRSGAVGRVCRQASPEDTAICERDVGNDPRYPLIPPGDEPDSLEPGCSAPVNNAPPTAVAAIAARAAQIAIEAATGDLTTGDELIEVYRPIDVVPFDRAGTVRRDP